MSGPDPGPFALARAVPHGIRGISTGLTGVAARPSAITQGHMTVNQEGD
jgi:hypothetical protein